MSKDRVLLNSYPQFYIITSYQVKKRTAHSINFFDFTPIPPKSYRNYLLFAQRPLPLNKDILRSVLLFFKGIE